MQTLRPAGRNFCLWFTVVRQVQPDTEWVSGADTHPNAKCQSRSTWKRGRRHFLHYSTAEPMCYRYWCKSKNMRHDNFLTGRSKVKVVQWGLHLTQKFVRYDTAPMDTKPKIKPRRMSLSHAAQQDPGQAEDGTRIAPLEPVQLNPRHFKYRFVQGDRMFLTVQQGSLEKQQSNRATETAIVAGQILEKCLFLTGGPTVSGMYPGDRDTESTIVWELSNQAPA
ncbi:hypothetical protein JZ751_007249 [Albula glossodonta]|uniref:Uncharacterized protein n=1 Tax=Albula glossodonta TaxID=121402 RepID=A0A8T2N3T2_9TELE|nr:hypothetical protein JZ751_007249 [Albula glossodonta]